MKTLDEIRQQADKTYNQKLPMILILKRKSLRTYPDGQMVAIYHADKIDQDIVIPLKGINNTT